MSDVTITLSEILLGFVVVGCYVVSIAIDARRAKRAKDALEFITALRRALLTKDFVRAVKITGAARHLPFA